MGNKLAVTNEAIMIICRPVADPWGMKQQCSSDVVGLDKRGI